MYLQHHSCDRPMIWRLLDVFVASGPQLERFEYREPVFRTLIFAILYVTVSLLMIIGCIFVLSEYKHKNSIATLQFFLLITVGRKHVARRRLESWLIYFAPFVVAWILQFILDITATTFYGIDLAKITVSSSMIL